MRWMVVRCDCVLRPPRGVCNPLTLIVGVLATFPIVDISDCQFERDSAGDCIALCQPLCPIRVNGAAMDLRRHNRTSTRGGGGGGRGPIAISRFLHSTRLLWDG